ncbi:DEAD/DEAH box helicase [Desulfobulbus alkaliphilus]|uniref:DEAD/DEAH box helicase n=1 Tax=Desulfobulbus alkaliphilus TaxID=869814 RepID=UPI001F06650E|nr:DEAD/DEAH box helicase [Desulfobulbus alkaliphilus]
MITGAPPELTAAIRAALTLENPKYQAAKRYGRWVGRQLKPHLLYYREEKNGLVFPRGFGNQAVLLCRRTTGKPPEIDDQRRLLPEIEFRFHGRLRAYQQRAVEAVLARSFGVLEAGTGSGKTVMCLNIVALRRQPTLILVHSKELLYQWRDRIRQFLDIETGQVGDGLFDLQPVTVAIVNSARKNLVNLPRHFGQIVVDECHRVPASLFTEVVAAFDSYYMLGLSATAFRREGAMTRLIYAYMGDRVYTVDNRILEASGAVVRPDLLQRSTGFVACRQWDYSSLIKALVNDEQRNCLIASDIVTLVRQGHQGTLLVVSDRVAHCRALKQLVKQQGVTASLLTGRATSDNRERIVTELREGRVAVLIATLQLIGEGFDCPGLSTLVLATPIKFEGRLLQVVGRIMRPARGKKARVIDYVDEHIPALRRSAAARRDVFLRW